MMKEVVQKQQEIIVPQYVNKRQKKSRKAQQLCKYKISAKTGCRGRPCPPKLSETKIMKNVAVGSTIEIIDHVEKTCK